MIISITSLKGGVGKSTITQNLAVCFAHSGYKVCIVDTDANRSSERWAVLRPETFPHVPVFVQSDDSLSQSVKALNRDYEIVLIDGTPSLSKVTSKIIMLADLVLIPILPSGLDIWATEQFIERYESAKEQLEQDIPAYFILNRYKPSTNFGKEFKAVLEETKVPLISNHLKDRTAYIEAVVQGIGVLEHKDEKAKIEISALYNEIISLIK